MAFKLRSGNSPLFKSVGSSPVRNNGEETILSEVRAEGDLRSEETVEQYNARVMADYESKLQSHADSTAAHTNRLESEQLVREIYKLGKKRTSEITPRSNFDSSGDDKNRYLSADEQLARGRTHDDEGKKIIAGDLDRVYYDPKNKLTKEQIAENIQIKKYNKPIIEEQIKKTKKNMELRRGNIKLGIYSDDDQLKYKGGLKPGPPPEKPNVGKIHHEKYYDPKTKEYRVTSYNPKKLKSGKYSSTGRGKQISDISLTEWKNKYED